MCESSSSSAVTYDMHYSTTWRPPDIGNRLLPIRASEEIQISGKFNSLGMYFPTSVRCRQPDICVETQPVSNRTSLPGRAICACKHGYKWFLNARWLRSVFIYERQVAFEQQHEQDLKQNPLRIMSTTPTHAEPVHHLVARLQFLSAGGPQWGDEGNPLAPVENIGLVMAAFTLLTAERCLNGLWVQAHNKPTNESHLAGRNTSLRQAWLHFQHSHYSTYLFCKKNSHTAPHCELSNHPLTP